MTGLTTTTRGHPCKLLLNASYNHTNQKANKKREAIEKSDELIMSGNGYKNPWDSSEKVRESTVGRIYGKG